MDGTNNIGSSPISVTGARDVADNSMPPRIRRWVIGCVAAILFAALYLIAVRGTAILFDLRDAVSAMCF